MAHQRDFRFEGPRFLRYSVQGFRRLRDKGDVSARCKTRSACTSWVAGPWYNDDTS